MKVLGIVIIVAGLLWFFRYHIPGYAAFMTRLEDDEDDSLYWR